MPLAPQVEPSPCADSPACRCSGRMVTLPTRPQPAGLWSGMEGGALGCTPSLPALWVQVAAGSCVLQLCVLVFGEKCLVQGSAGSLGTLTLTRSGCQLWRTSCTDADVYTGRAQRGEPPLTEPHRRHFRQCPRLGGGRGRRPGWRTDASSAGSPGCTGPCPR